MALGYLSYLVTRSQVLEGTRELTREVDELRKGLEDTERTMRQDIIPFMDQLRNQPPNPLTGLQQVRKNQLLETLEERRLTPLEAYELRSFLQIELEEARQKGDNATAVAIVAVLLLIALGIAAATSKR